MATVPTAPRCLVVASMAVVVTSVASAEPPKLDYFFPAGVPRGKTTEVTASGTFERWPVNVWCNESGVKVSPGEKKGKLSVTIASECNTSVCWLRLYDTEGATQLRPLLIGTLPELLEAEPNDAPDQPQSVEQPMLINGKLSKRREVDSFAVRLEQGQTLVASLQANNLIASPMDAVLQITNARGFVLAQNNDARGLDPLIAFDVPNSGMYLVRAFAFPSKPNSTIDFAGAEDYVYRLTITTGPIVDHTLPLAARRGATTSLQLVGWNISDREAVGSIRVDAESASDSFSFSSDRIAGSVELAVHDTAVVVEQLQQTPVAPQEIKIPAVVSGTLSEKKEVDVYRLTARKGQKLDLAVESHSLGFPLDAVLEVVDSGGKLLAESDDASRTERDPRLTFTAPADEEFDVRVRDLHGRGGMRYAYRLAVELQAPRFELSLAAGEFVVKAGEAYEIPVTVNRDVGFGEEIEVSATTLPEGISAVPVTSQPKGETAKAVKLKFMATKEALSGTFRIVGRSSAEQRASSARFTYEGRAESHTDVWLTVQPRQ